MTQSLLSVAAFLVLLACLPFAIKWSQRKLGVKAADAGTESRIISAVAVGPHQRVVTVEVGPEGGRIWLTVGVTPQSIQCLHTAPVQGASRGVAGSDNVRLSQTA